MKKTIKVLAFLLIMMTVLTVVASASGENTASYNYEVDDTEYTVTFSNSSMSREKQEAIARKLVGIDDSSAQTYGLKCTLFGHDYVYETAYVTTHKVRTTAPRCKKTEYAVTYCDDCDYYEEEIVGTEFIDCCS
ncbi:MAG: hypothetical protein IKK70_04285 [Clostridia bacterium]|nr:hypothetical protein [Clostridia bacterium]